MRPLIILALLLGGCAHHVVAERAVHTMGIFAIDVVIFELVASRAPLCSDEPNDPPHTCPDVAAQPER